jgi:hypothetical protein
MLGTKFHAGVEHYIEVMEFAGYHWQTLAISSGAGYVSHASNQSYPNPMGVVFIS